MCVTGPGGVQGQATVLYRSEPGQAGHRALNPQLQRGAADPLLGEA